MEPSDTTEVTEEVLPPPPSVIPHDGVGIQVKPEHTSESVKKTTKSKRVPMSRRGFGSKGQKISLLTNHFKVGITNASGHFFHYSVSLSVCLCLFTGFFFFVILIDFSFAGTGSLDI